MMRLIVFTILSVALISACARNTSRNHPDGGGSMVTAITVSPPTSDVTLQAGAQFQFSGSANFTATATFDDGHHEDVTANAVWTDSDLMLTSINAGAVTVRAAGAYDVMASLNGMSGSARLTANV